MRRMGWLGVALLVASAAEGAVAGDGEAKSGSGAVVTANSEDGFTIGSEDGNFKLNLTGYAQGDFRFYLSDANSDGVDTFLMRQVRPMLSGTVDKYFDFNIIPDFGQGQTVLYDAYLDAKFAPAFKVKVGKFKPPVGLERLELEYTIPFAERALPTDLVPTRDVGAEIHGDLGGGVVSYEAGVFDGALDYSLADGDTNDAKDVAGRIMFQPFKTSSLKALKDLTFGFAGTTGKQAGAVPSYKSVGQLTFFSYASNVTADGTRRRFSPQLAYQNGPFRLISEYVSEREGLEQTPTGKPVQTLTANEKSWETTASLIVTGEAQRAGGLIVPKADFDPKQGHWGAVLVAARYSTFSIDSDVFSLGYADPTKSARKASEWGIAATWYLTRWVKVATSFDHTTFEGGASGGGNRHDENALILRCQVGF